MIAYLDASALAKLFLDEPGSVELRGLWENSIAVGTSEITITELACALAAAVRHRRCAAHDVDESVFDGTYLLERADLVAVDHRLLRSAAQLGARHALRALDAIHVASALVLREAGIVLVSWDNDQRRAAAAEGIPVYP